MNFENDYAKALMKLRVMEGWGKKPEKKKTKRRPAWVMDDQARHILGAVKDSPGIQGFELAELLGLSGHAVRNKIRPLILRRYVRSERLKGIGKGGYPTTVTTYYPVEAAE